jgi:hypothetical protein
MVFLAPSLDRIREREKKKYEKERIQKTFSYSFRQKWGRF